mgnify:CR=1 FL=1
MKYALLFMLTISLVFSCKPSEARRPISNNSGSFIDASIERNKQLNNKEINRFQDRKIMFHIINQKKVLTILL